MYCPRCGTQNQAGDRFCVSCGATLRKSTPAAETRTPRERLDRLIGTTRRTRLLTAGTAAAIVIAIAAFVAIPAAKDESSDAYTRSADDICVQAKQQIVAVEQRIPPASGPGRFTEALVPIVAGWRYGLNSLHTPSEHADQTRELDLALRELEIIIGTIARVSQEGGGTDLLALAKRGDEASARVEDAVDALGLSRCGELAVGLVRVPPSRR